MPHSHSIYEPFLPTYEIVPARDDAPTRYMVFCPCGWMDSAPLTTAGLYGLRTKAHTHRASAHPGAIHTSTTPPLPT